MIDRFFRFMWMSIPCAIVAVIGLSLTDTSGGQELIGIVFALCFTLLFTLFYAGVGYGLLKMQSWARIAAIVLAILSLCSFPIGTILGGVVLYFMFQQETIQAFS